jgi:hypothetical protein
VSPRVRVPGAALLSPIAFASALLVLWNDLWLKRQHPGLLSGKLSDIGLCVFLPLLLAAVLEWADEVRVIIQRGATLLPSLQVHGAACALTVVYFVAIKCWPQATQAHVAWLTALGPGWRFRAVTDPTDLFCLPAVLLAWRTLSASSRTQRYRARGGPALTGGPNARPLDPEYFR